MSVRQYQNLKRRLYDCNVTADFNQDEISSIQFVFLVYFVIVSPSYVSVFSLMMVIYKRNI